MIELMVHAYDFSKKAVDTMRSVDEYDEKHMRAEVWDVTSGLEDGVQGLPPGLEAGSVDVVILIFIFSALSPLQWAKAVENVYRVLKPGGEVLFRDYGRGDLAQVRFKSGRWMEDNFYVRGDGTRVYFFEKEQLEQIWSGSMSTSGNAGQSTFQYPESGRGQEIDCQSSAEAEDVQMLDTRSLSETRGDLSPADSAV